MTDLVERVMPRRAVCTVVTKSYLSYARVMSARLAAVNPGVPLIVFMADRPDGLFDPLREPFQVVMLDEFVPPRMLESMAGYYTAFEFANALKAFAHLFLSDRGAERWVYLDADVFVHSSLDEIFGQLDHAAILLTPHILRPGALAVSERYELAFLRFGIFNGGFLGVRNTPAARAFLLWWRERLQWLSLKGVPGLEADQSWLNFAPVLFSDVAILRALAANVAYWNIHERALELGADGSVGIEQKPLMFIHFSGWNWRLPTVPTRYPGCDLGASTQAWNAMATEFAAALVGCGVETTSAWPYSFATSHDGRELTPSTRRAYRKALRESATADSVPSVFDQPDLYRTTAYGPRVRAALYRIGRAVRRTVARRLGDGPSTAR